MSTVEKTSQIGAGNLFAEMPVSLDPRPLAGAALLVFAVLAAYLPSINGGFLFDDNLLLTDNALIKAPDGLFRCWFTTHQPDYVPLTSSTLWLEWRLWGTHPAGYRVTNLLLHVAGCLLIWALLRRLAIPGAYLAALLYAIHPVNVESVAWIEQRKNTLSLVFFLLCLLWYVRDDQQRGTSDERTRPKIGVSYWYWLSLLACALSMFSKGSAAILPLALLLIAWWRRGRLLRDDLLRIAPFFLISAILTPIIIWFVAHGAPETVRPISFGERAAGAGSIIWFYLSKAFVPLDLSFVYPQWRADVANLLWWLPWLTSLLVTVTLVRHRQNPWGRALLLAWGYYWIALLPVLGFSDAGYMRFSLVADHYQYIALIGAATLAAAGWTLWVNRCGTSSVTWAVAMVTLLTLEFLCWQQSRLYAQPVKLYQAALKHSPDSYFVRNNLGVELAKLDRTDEAIEQYRAALRLKPDYALAYYNLGESLLHAGRAQEAIEQYEQALRFDPKHAGAHQNLANALRKTGHMQEAIEHYKQALELSPSFPEAHFNFGNALVEQNQLKEAIQQYEAGLQFDPNNAQAHYALGNALRAAKLYTEAVGQYQQAIRLQPDYPDAQANLAALMSHATPSDTSLPTYQKAAQAAPHSFEAHYNLAIAQLSAGKAQQAIENFHSALALKPDQPDAHQGLGTALVMLGRPGEALEHFQQVVRVKPNDAQAHNNLATALVNLGRLSEAAEHYQEAVRLKPDYLDAWTNLVLAYDHLHRTDEAVATAQKLVELARSQGQTALAEKVEAFLATQRKTPSK